MMGRTRVLVIAATVGIAALIGAEAYHAGQSNGVEKAENNQLNQETSMQAPQSQPQPNGAAPIVTAKTGSELSASNASAPPYSAPNVPQNYPPVGESKTYAAPPVANYPTPPEANYAAPPPAANPALTSETPRVATVYTAPSNTVIEKETVYRNRPVYRTRVVRHYKKKNGKVHVGRAVKHTASFIAKLPGRMRM
ncbi:MAG TPA: hypothetical protein V6C81_27555 [Planktothrix sp.]|jgi:hypothetical protein